MNAAMSTLSTQMNDVVSNGFMTYVDANLKIEKDHLYHSMMPIDSYHMYTLASSVSAQ